MSDIIEVPLPGFARRTDRTSDLKLLIKSSGVLLSRKGRSRNWELRANIEQLIQLSMKINQSNEESWHWVAKRLAEYKPSLSSGELHRIAKQYSTITVSELVALTDCTIGEARRVIDDIEWN